MSREAKRATVSGADVIKGLKELEFDDLVEQIEICIAGTASPPYISTVPTHLFPPFLM